MVLWLAMQLVTTYDCCTWHYVQQLQIRLSMLLLLHRIATSTFAMGIYCCVSEVYILCTNVYLE